MYKDKLIFALLASWYFVLGVEHRFSSASILPCRFLNLCGHLLYVSGTGGLSS